MAERILIAAAHDLPARLQAELISGVSSWHGIYNVRVENNRNLVCDCHLNVNSPGHSSLNAYLEGIETAWNTIRHPGYDYRVTYPEITLIESKREVVSREMWDDAARAYIPKETGPALSFKVKMVHKDFNGNNACNEAHQFDREISRKLTDARWEHERRIQDVYGHQEDFYGKAVKQTEYPNYDVQTTSVGTEYRLRG